MHDGPWASRTGLEGQATALAAGETSSAELVAACLERIEAAQPRSNAFRCVRAEGATQEAEECDRRIAAGETAPLLGVPIAIKDDTDIAGETTAFGCAGDFDVIDEDSEVVRRLREAGAVIVGKTTTSEFGQWPFIGEPGVRHHPQSLGPRPHPGRLERRRGAAVAAGLVAGAIGSDGAGSVRIPAAWCHLVGIKPQRGRISTWPHPEAFKGLTCLGPAHPDGRRRRALLDAVAGNREGDLHRPPAPGRDLSGGRRARRRHGCGSRSPPAIPFSGAPAKLDPEIRAATERMGGVLEGLGHTVEEADPAYGLVGASFMPRSMGGIREWVDRIAEPEVLDPAPATTRRSASSSRAPLLAGARALERPLRARSAGSSTLRRRPGADDREARPADRRGRGPRRMGDRQADRRRLPLRVAVERDRLARRERARRAHGRRAADRRLSCSARRTRRRF